MKLIKKCTLMLVLLIVFLGLPAAILNIAPSTVDSIVNAEHLGLVQSAIAQEPDEEPEPEPEPEPGDDPEDEDSEI